MLTEQDFIRIEKKANQLYANLELDIIEEIATRIANFGYANTVVVNDIKIVYTIGSTVKIDIEIKAGAINAYAIFVFFLFLCILIHLLTYLNSSYQSLLPPEFQYILPPVPV